MLVGDCERRFRRRLIFENWGKESRGPRAGGFALPAWGFVNRWMGNAIGSCECVDGGELR
jgi:hypothetical protein